MENDRYRRWVLASHTVTMIEPFMIHTVQGLGRIDVQLFEKDRRFRQIRTESNIQDHDLIELNDSIIQAYLWVLGTYEIVRALNQRLREKGDPDDPAYIASQQIKKLFERIRVPLAKFEPARRHKETDSKVAYPALNASHGIAWQVAKDHFISRGELSEAFLGFMEKLRSSVMR